MTALISREELRPNSGQVATVLESLGYANIHNYAAGIEDWTSANLPIESAASTG